MGPSRWRRCKRRLPKYKIHNRVRLTLPLLHQLKEMRTRAAAFAQPDDTTVCYVEYSGIKSGPGLSHLSLCAVPRDLPRQLYDLLWR